MKVKIQILPIISGMICTLHKFEHCYKLKNLLKAQGYSL